MLEKATGCSVNSNEEVIDNYSPFCWRTKHEYFTTFYKSFHNNFCYSILHYLLVHASELKVIMNKDWTPFSCGKLVIMMKHIVIIINSNNIYSECLKLLFYCIPITRNHYNLCHRYESFCEHNQVKLVICGRKQNLCICRSKR